MIRVAPTIEDPQRYPVLGAIDEREEKVKAKDELDYDQARHSTRR